MANCIAALTFSASTPVREMQEHDEARRALNEGADGRTVVRSLDEVTLPVARHGPIICLGGPVGDHDFVRNRSPALDAAFLGAVLHGPIEGNGRVHGGARPGPRRRVTGRSSRSSLASSDRLGTRYASGRRFPRGTTRPRAIRLPLRQRRMAEFGGFRTLAALLCPRVRFPACVVMPPAVGADLT